MIIQARMSSTRLPGKTLKKILGKPMIFRILERVKRCQKLDKITSWGYGNLPVCMAKTQYSFSHDAGKLGAPSGFTLPVREFRLNAGAGFVVAILGNMMTMPGLPKRPAALNMDMDDDGNQVGIFG